MRNCVSCGAAVAPRFKYCDDCRDTAAVWRPDYDGISRATKRLKITVPVVIRRVTTNKLLGRYHGIKLRDDHPTDMDVIVQMSDDELRQYMYHFITVSARITPDRASRVLWHELTHASQMENVDNYKTLYDTEYRIIKEHAAELNIPLAAAYKLISFEVEAIKNEDRHKKTPLTLANRRAVKPKRGLIAVGK